MLYSLLFEPFYWLLHYAAQSILYAALQYIFFLAIDCVFKVLLQHEAMIPGATTWHYFLVEGSLLAVVAGSIRYTLNISPMLLWTLSACNVAYGLMRVWLGQQEIVALARRIAAAFLAVGFYLHRLWCLWRSRRLQQWPEPQAWQQGYGYSGGSANYLAPGAQSGTCATPQIGYNNRIINAAAAGTLSSTQALAWQPSPNAGTGGSVISNLCRRFVGQPPLQDQQQLVVELLRPVGFVNLGSNSCFMNACLQLLLNNDRFVSALRSCGRNRSASVTHEAVLDAMQALADRRHRIQQQSRLASQQDHLDDHHFASRKQHHRLDLLDTQQLRRALAQLCPLVQPLGLPQQQQDAVEFFTLLLDALLEASRNSVVSNGFDATIWTPTLERLSRAYPDVDMIRSSDARLRLLDSASLEVTFAHQPADIPSGLANRACSASLVRLADLHWLERRLGECRSPLGAAMEGQMVDLILCEACHRLSAKCQAVLALPVPLPLEPVGGTDPCPVSLTDCLSNSVGQLESLGGLRCSFCAASAADSPIAAAEDPEWRLNNNHRQLQHVQRRMTMTSTPVAAGSSSPYHAATPIRRGQPYQKCQLFGKLPRLLALQLMRCVPASGGNSHLSLTKNERQVKIPLRLDCSSLLLSRNSSDLDAAAAAAVYELSGLILHEGSGSTNSGHYTALCRCQGRWYNCDDHSVTDCGNIERFLISPGVASAAYLLLYELV